LKYVLGGGQAGSAARRLAHVPLLANYPVKSIISNTLILLVLSRI